MIKDETEDFGAEFGRRQNCGAVQLFNCAQWRSLDWVLRLDH